MTALILLIATLTLSVLFLLGLADLIYCLWKGRRVKPEEPGKKIELWDERPGKGVDRHV